MLRLSSFTEALPNPKKAFMGRSLLSRQDALHICFAGEMDRWTVIYVIFLFLFFCTVTNFMPIFRSDFIIFIWHRQVHIFQSRKWLPSWIRSVVWRAPRSSWRGVMPGVHRADFLLGKGRDDLEK